MSPDFKDLLSEFNAAGVEYLVVGAYAMAAHGRVRATGDLDVWVKPSPENAKRVLAALRQFGVPLHDLTAEDLNRPDVVFQIGQEPLRIDVLTSIDAVDFQAAWENRFTTKLGDHQVGVLSASDLIKNKRAVARPQDLADVDWLEKAGKG